MHAMSRGTKTSFLSLVIAEESLVLAITIATDVDIPNTDYIV